MFKEYTGGFLRFTRKIPVEIFGIKSLITKVEFI